jgi:hypothetical protein
MKMKMKRGNSKNKNNNDNRKRPPPPPPPPLPGVIASRTRRQKRAIESKWDIPIPIIIQIISWLDQDSLMDLSLVSKQLRDIICNEPGNKNRIIPVLEVSGSSVEILLSNLRDYYLNNKTKIKLEQYHIMTFKDVDKFIVGESSHELLEQIVKDLRMDGILTLDLSLQYDDSRLLDYADNAFLYYFTKIFQNLQELVVSNVEIGLNSFLENCPLLEKVTSNNNYYGVFLAGSNIKFSNN